MSLLTRKLLQLAVLSRWAWLALACFLFYAVTPWLVPVIIFAVIFGKYKAGTLAPKISFGDLMGSARLSTLDDAIRAGAVGTGGIPLGVMPAPTFKAACRALRTAPWWAARDAVMVFRAWWKRLPVPLALRRAVNAAIFAPVGVGKSTALIIPWLLQNPRTSAVVLDIKGELLAATARERRKAGGQIVVIDPYGVTGCPSDSVNPIGDLAWGDVLLVDKARQVAESNVIRNANEHQPHFNDAAENLISAAIAFQVWVADSNGDAGQKTLGEVFRLIADRKRFRQAMELLAQCPDHDGTVGALASVMLTHSGEEEASVFSVALRHLNWVNTPITRKITAATSFDPARLRGRKPLTVYIVVPPNALAEKRGFIRSVLTRLLRACIEAGPDPHARVQFLLDEYAALGRMEVIENALTQLRGYGVRLLFAFQSVKQLERAFPEGGSDTFMANVTQMFCGIQDYPTAELASKWVGRETVSSYTFNGGDSESVTRPTFGEGGSRSFSTTENWSASPHQREIFQPEEILQLGPDVLLTFTPGMAPLVTHPVKHFEKRYRAVRLWGRGGFAMLLRAVVLCGLSGGGLFAAWVYAVPVALAHIEQAQREYRERVMQPGTPGAGWPQPGQKFGQQWR